jgi:hypothetical protein
MWRDGGAKETRRHGDAKTQRKRKAVFIVLSEVRSLFTASQLLSRYRIYKLSMVSMSWRSPLVIKSIIKEIV